MAVARAIAIRHLPGIASNYEVKFFSADAFNKLFLLHLLDDAPVKYTSIPVPRVIALDTSTDNELGFEWILMSKIQGVALTSLWESPALVWEERVQIAKTLAGYVKQLSSPKFPLIGNLYSSRRPEFGQIAWLKDPLSETCFVPLPDDAEFAQGPLVTIPFFYGDRVHLRNDRGPFETSSEYLSSFLNLHIASATSRKAAANADDEYDSDDISELEDAITAHKSLLSILPTLFPPDTGNFEIFSLYHDDMSSNNIPIDPITHRITGIVDWECVSLQPSWKVAKVPKLLDE
jgi:hypothetical protein